MTLDTRDAFNAALATIVHRTEHPSEAGKAVLDLYNFYTEREEEWRKLRTCGGCKHWEPYGPREVPTVTSGECKHLMDSLYFTYHHPPYAGGSTVESVEVARDFGCTLWEKFPEPATEPPGVTEGGGVTERGGDL